MRGWHKATQRQIPTKTRPPYIQARADREKGDLQPELCGFPLGHRDALIDSFLPLPRFPWLCPACCPAIKMTVGAVPWHRSFTEITLLDGNLLGSNEYHPAAPGIARETLSFNCTDGPKRSGTYSTTCLKDAFMIWVRFIIFCPFTRMHPQIITRSGWASQQIRLKMLSY